MKTQVFTYADYCVHNDMDALAEEYLSQYYERFPTHSAVDVDSMAELCLNIVLDYRALNNDDLLLVYDLENHSDDFSSDLYYSDIAVVNSDYVALCTESDYRNLVAHISAVKILHEQEYDLDLKLGEDNCRNDSLYCKASFFQDFFNCKKNSYQHRVNLLASALLMPKDLLQEAISRFRFYFFGDDSELIKSIAFFFNVPLSLAEFRLSTFFSK